MQALRLGRTTLLRTPRAMVSGYGNIDSNQQDGHIPKVNDQLVWLTVQNTRGFHERISGFVGENLMACLQRHKVDFVPGNCQGGEDLLAPMTMKPIDPTAYGPYCGGCVVHIGQPHRDQMGQIHQLEEKVILNVKQDISYETRLSCCLLLEPWMDEMFLKVGQNQMDNQSEDVRF